MFSLPEPPYHGLYQADGLAQRLGRLEHQRLRNLASSLNISGFEIWLHHCRIHALFESHLSSLICQCPLVLMSLGIIINPSFEPSRACSHKPVPGLITRQSHSICEGIGHTASTPEGVENIPVKSGTSVLK